MKFKNTQVWGFEHALRGMRNPKNSWSKSDSWDMSPDDPDFDSHGGYWIGPNDMQLAQTLIKGGSEHRKFLRQIFVSVDITAPQVWWSEFDTYKVGTVANSTSKMHKIQSKPITLDCFEIDNFNSNLTLYNREPYNEDYTVGDFSEEIIEKLETLRKLYLETKDKKYWYELIRWLPESWLQTRTVTMNYENLLAMCSPGQRRFHKLNWWSGIDDPFLTNFIQWARTLPYAQQFIFIDETVSEKEKMDKLISNLGISLQTAAGTRKTAAELAKEINAKILALYN